MLRVVRSSLKKASRGPMQSQGNAIPRTGLLLYLGAPNSDEYLVGEDTDIGEGTYIWGYFLGSDTAIRAATGWTTGNANVFYGATGDPIVALASEVIGSAGINTGTVLFKVTSVAQQLGKLAIYATGTNADVLAKAKSVLKIV